MHTYIVTKETFANAALIANVTRPVYTTMHTPNKTDVGA